MTLLCFPQREGKNSALPFTVAVSTWGITIFWLKHCFLHIYLYNFISSEKEDNNDPSFAHGTLNKSKGAYKRLTSQQPGPGLALRVPRFGLPYLPDITVKFLDLNITRTRAIIYHHCYYYYFHYYCYFYPLTHSGINN